jgi:hypothetical protein
MKQLLNPVFGRLRQWIWRPAFRPYIVYAVCLAAMFAGLARLDARCFAIWPASVHLSALLALTFLLGALFVVLALPRYFSHRSDRITTALVLAGTLWGMVFFFLAIPRTTWRAHPLLYGSVFLPAVVGFALPWLFRCAVHALIAIPPLRFAPLIVDHLRDVMAVVRWGENREKGFRWVFEESFPELGTGDPYTLQTFSPWKVEHELTLDFLLRALLALHNHNFNPQQAIVFTASDGRYGWEFYAETGWLRRRRALDPFRTPRQNRLRFRVITEAQRRQSTENLSPHFRVATIYLRRTLLPVPATEPVHSIPVFA